MQWFIDIIKDWILTLNYVTMSEVIKELRGGRVLAFRHTSTQAVGDAWVRIIFNDEIFDTKDDYSPTNGIFRARSAGYYKFTWQVGFMPPLGADRKFFTSLFINTVHYAGALTQSSHNDYLASVGSVLIWLEERDSVEIKALQTSGYDVNIDYTNELTFLNVHKLA